jgi:hypothetical protein
MPVNKSKSNAEAQRRRGNAEKNKKVLVFSASPLRYLCVSAVGFNAFVTLTQ